MSRYDEYLGDGVYVGFDGYHIVLDLREQDTSRIALEPSVFNSLMDYKERMYAIAKAEREKEQASE